MNLTLKETTEVTSLAKGKAEELNVSANIVVLDVCGRLKAFEIMDFASSLSSLDAAHSKAKMTGLFLMSNDIPETDMPVPTVYGLAASTDGGLVSFAGGIPIHRYGDIIGYIAVTGGSAAQDFVIAVSGASLYTRFDNRIN